METEVVVEAQISHCSIVFLDSTQVANGARNQTRRGTSSCMIKETPMLSVLSVVETQQ